MKLIIDNKELLSVIQYCFENYGLSELESCDVGIEYYDKDYKYARAKLKDARPGIEICYEEVLMVLLGDGKLSFKDYNDVAHKNHNDDGKIIPFTKEIAEKNLNEMLSGKNAMEITRDVLDILEEDGNADAGTAFRLLQYMLFKELVYA